MKKIILTVLCVLLLFATPCYATEYQNPIYFDVMGNVSVVAGTLYPDGCTFGNDSQHTPVNMTSAGFTDGGIMINFPMSSKVISLLITPDDTLLKSGYIVSGSSVGLNSALFRIGKMFNVYGGANYNGGWHLSYTNSPDYTIYLSDQGNGVLRVYHSGDAGLIPPMLTGRVDGYKPQVGLFAPDYFDVWFYDSAGNRITTYDSKCNFLFTRCGYRVIDPAKEQWPEGGNFWICGIMLR